MEDFNLTYDNDLKDRKVSDDVISICATNAILKTRGVARLSGGVSDAVSQKILGKEPIAKGIKVWQDDDGIEMDIYVVLEYGMKIPLVAWDIQNNVKKEIENITEHKVKNINVHVQGIDMPKIR